MGAGEAEGGEAEEVTIDLEEASAWRRSRRCNDKFRKKDPASQTLVEAVLSKNDVERRFVGFMFLVPLYCAFKSIEK